MVNILLFFLSVLFISTIGFQTHLYAQDSSLTEERPFFIGKVSTNPKKQNELIQPMANYMATQLGFSGGGALFTKSIDEMLLAFSENKVDLFTGSAYEAAVLVESGLGNAIATKIKQGEEDYRSIIVTRRDSGIDSIEQLVGNIIAFEDESSTSAYIVPRMILEKNGLRLAIGKEKPDNNQLIHYRFSESEQNSSAWLYRNIVDAIAISDSDWNNSQTIPEYLKQEFQIIHSSASIPRAIEVVRSNLSVKVKQSIQNVLFNMSNAVNSTEPELASSDSPFLSILKPDGREGQIFRNGAEFNEIQSILNRYHHTEGFKPVSNDLNIYLKHLATFYKK